MVIIIINNYNQACDIMLFKICSCKYSFKYAVYAVEYAFYAIKYAFYAIEYAFYAIEYAFYALEYGIILKMISFSSI